MNVIYIFDEVKTLGSKALSQRCWIETTQERLAERGDYLQQQCKLAGGLSLSQTVQAAFVVVDANEKRATVAVSSTVLREVDPRDGGQAVTIRIAHSRESASLAFGKSQRVVLSPTFGRGGSALVLDVVIERLPGKN